MIASRNPVHSALYLVCTLVALGVIYLILSAPVLFAVQLIVYAGAIMILFLFVIMFFMAPSALRWLRPPLMLLDALSSPGRPSRRWGPPTPPLTHRSRQ